MKRSQTSFWQQIKSSRLIVKLSFIVIIIWVFTSLAAPLLATHDPSKTNPGEIFIRPFAKDSKGHLLGTDEVGRDVFSRLVYGSRISLLVAVIAGIISLLIGTSLGLIAGYFGGRVDSIIMRIVDAMLAFPFMFMALVFMVALGSGLRNIVLVLGITGWVSYTRTIRAEVLSIRRREYVISAEVIGCSSGRVIFRHILPNVIDHAIVIATMNMANTILSEASLTFLGMGLPVSIPSWGQMIATGRTYTYTAGWLTIIPGIAIFLVTLSINFIGDWLRDIRDPRLRGSQ